MRILNIAIISTLLLILSACASVSLTKDIKVDAKVDQKAELSGYKSYAWLGAAKLLNDPEKKWQAPKMDIAGDIKYLIDRELRKREIFAATESPDLVVGFFMGIDMETMELKEDPNDNIEVLQNVPKAGLIVVLVDAETGFVVWMGVAEGDLHENASDEMVRTRLDYAVSKMFKLLPMQ
jgi:hypothetical protein